jgi:hypothetical protein
LIGSLAAGSFLHRLTLAEKGRPMGDTYEETIEDSTCIVCDAGFERDEDECDYGYCPKCLVDQILNLEKERDEYAEAVEIVVRRLGFELDGDDANAFDQHCGYREHNGDSPDYDYQPNSDRAVISYLRHNATNYEEILADLPDCLDTGDEYNGMEPELDLNRAYYRIRNRVHEAIVVAYPEVAGMVQAWLEHQDCRV